MKSDDLGFFDNGNKIQEGKVYTLNSKDVFREIMIEDNKRKRVVTHYKRDKRKGEYPQNESNRENWH